MKFKSPSPRTLMALALSFSAAAFSSCGSNQNGGEANTLRPTISPTDPVNPTVPTTGSSGKDILLYNGAGVDTSDWQNTERLLKNRGYSYELVNATQMNAMSMDTLVSFRMILVPGGYGGTIYGNISAAARLRIRQAVRDHGLGYLGFCAGAWVGVGPEAESNSTAAYGFAVAKGSQLQLWRDGGDNVSMQPVSFSDGSSRYLVLWGGPATPSWSGGVVGKYSDGRPAISQTWSGKGFVVVSGPHPEAPQDWRSEAGTDQDGLDYAVAYNLIDAALQKKPLAAF